MNHRRSINFFRFGIVSIFLTAVGCVTTNQSAESMELVSSIVTNVLQNLLDFVASFGRNAFAAFLF